MDIKCRSDYFSVVHSLSRLFAFSALTNYNIWQRGFVLTEEMPLLGHLEEFCTESEIFRLTWTAWNSFIYFFIANAIGCGNQTKCKAILLRAIGKKTYRFLEDLCTPQKPNEKSLEEITQRLLEHFRPKHLVVAEGFKFYKAKQEEGESISNFLVRLKHLTSTCEFGSFLKSALRDKFVCGFKDDKIQEKLNSRQIA